jgi:hypothetical protein
MSTARLFLWSPSDDHVLLATIEVPSQSRVTVLSQRWCERAGIDAKVLAVVGALGRSDGSLDWGVWVRGDGRMPTGHSVPLSNLARYASDPRDRRLARALVDIIKHPHPSNWIGFNPAWPELVREWVSEVMNEPCDGDILPFRADCTALVTRCHLAGRDLFFTARPLPFIDPDLCGVLRDHSSTTFPRTLAYDSTRGWWLTADAGGLNAAHYVDRDGHRAALLLEAMAHVQASTFGSADLQRLSYCVTREAVLEGVARLCDDERALMCGMIQRLWIDVGAEKAPAGWVHSDPSPDNIRVDDDGGVVFLDLEDPWFGPILLMGALAIHSMSRRCRWTDDERSALCANAWQRYAAACGFANHDTFESWLRLAQLVRLIRRVERSTTESPLLLEEEVPRRSWAIRSELRRLCR